MLLLKAALLCSLYIPQVNLLTLGFSNIKESPSEVQSISGLAEYEYPLLEKLWTRIGSSTYIHAKAVERNSLIHKRTAASTRIAWIHTHRWRKIPGALVELNSVCYMTPRSAMLSSGETTSDREPRRENGSSVFARVCTDRSSHAHLRTTGQQNRHTNSPLSL